MRNLRQTLAEIEAVDGQSDQDISKLQETWNDALKFKDDALNAFRLGYLSLPKRSVAEQLTWACANAIAQKLPSHEAIPEELSNLKAELAATFYANLSVFRSAPDCWAIDQLFPLLPIHRLNEAPEQLGHFADLTCDSDGKLARFIANGQSKPLLELHALTPGEPYWIGLFLGGAYQEVMGNLHNLFGATNAVHIRLSPSSGYQVDHVVRGHQRRSLKSDGARPRSPAGAPAGNQRGRHPKRQPVNPRSPTPNGSPRDQSQANDLST